MIINPKTGLTLRQIYDFLSILIDSNRDSIMALKELIDQDYEVSDDVLDALEHKEKLTPEDICILAKAVGMIYELLTSKTLPDDFIDRFCSAVDNLYTLRNRYRPKKGE